MCNSSFISSCSDLYDYNMELVETLLSDPYEILNAMDVAIKTAQLKLLDEYTPSQQQYMVQIDSII